jgi:hypothetical protein
MRYGQHGAVGELLPNRVLYQLVCVVIDGRSRFV